MSWPVLALLVFAMTAATDIAWTRYTLAVASRRSHAAAAWSAVIILVGAITVLAYTEDRTMVFPAAAGAYLGTWLAVRERKKPKACHACGLNPRDCLQCRNRGH